MCGLLVELNHIYILIYTFTYAYCRRSYILIIIIIHTTSGELCLGENECVDVDLDKQEVACLNDATLDKLVRMGERVKEHYGNAPQDIEWAVSNGSIYLLQTRPITTLGGFADAATLVSRMFLN